MVAIPTETCSLKSLVLACEEVLVSVGETRTGWVVIVEGVESKVATVCKIGKNRRDAWIAANAIRGLLMNKDAEMWTEVEP